jgi:uncharacterized protein with von Willebrand factor type A (vWA) domain
VRFARCLRQEGISFSPAQTLDSVHCLTWIDIADRGSVRAAARTVFVHRRDDIAPFAAAFERFWSNTVLDPRTKHGIFEDLRYEPVWALDSVQASDVAEFPEDAPDRALAYSLAERLRQRDFGALTGAEATAVQAAIAAHDWGGGTRIGACLQAFDAQWAPLVLGRGAIVLLISDGCDRGEIPLLRSQIARLQRRSHRLIWLNPWLGQEGYQPSVRGMQAALPHIDCLLPIHNLASLEQLVATLADIDVQVSRR